MMRTHQPLTLRSRTEFLWRQLRYTGAGLGFMLLSLGMGVLGYHFLAHIGWIDSLLNASMILSGMGPVSGLHGTVAKLFASVYALYSGIVYLAVSAVLLYPLVERLLKILHLRALNTPPPAQRNRHPDLSED
ncbi:MAG: hypothetical protein ACYC45_03370 [Acidithiobacillus ferriphilus]|jgi:hypothetical protein|uniref:Two pore domain potassium channel family protein n=3 Tax=Acidithiobacillus TaxID=119977 RepID=A0A179BN04_ACIFR|nr:MULTISPECIES: hypothetical protein [Acidithiobacillus]OYV81272.1 MAG: hypothetical protein B7Z70_06100 [Acidithiobacillus ferrivorans]MDA8152013.1 hypothetical protein [Acidithiobacillus sp.]MDA8181845.1 hypothetical protein [Acidithiobacillus sp.]MDA8245308.1 hypothetical protein [Acidithiobacillus sp.]MEB8476219.1 hypothetical protein [Acidithiobacillus ferriphilus]